MDAVCITRLRLADETCIDQGKDGEININEDVTSVDGLYDVVATSLERGLSKNSLRSVKLKIW